MNTIVVQTRYDHLTAPGARQIITYILGCLKSLDVELTWEDTVNLCIGRPASITDAIQYAIDVLNDEVPEGHWYYLTADNNLALDEELTEPRQWMPHGVDPIGETG